ncbi:MAG: hypothetical protein JST95_03140, partial [Bacteroidetes bacterium]|nr:hypothetical protein [Bacteroidota bacterium]
MMRKPFQPVLAIFLFFAAFLSCKKNDAPLPDNLINFETNEQGLPESQASIHIKVKLSRSENQNINASFTLQGSSGVEYGTDYTTVPAANANTITLTIPAGASEGEIVVNKTANALFFENDQLKISLASVNSPVIAGTITQFTLKFSEIISLGASIVGDGGGVTFGNKVFFDLSANTQKSVLRTNWDLGFYSGADWRVLLNSSTGTMAKQINKNNLNDVSSADTIGFANDEAFSQENPTTQSLAYIDYPDGDLSKTAIAAISATDADNKVYIINRGFGVGEPMPSRGWKKIRVIRNTSGGYTLQYADINSSSFQTIDIPKNASHFFNYVSFENGAVDVDPESDKWDFAWSYFSNVANFGFGEFPYLFQDFISLNRGVQS